jgi:hypothetical protein
VRDKVGKEFSNTTRCQGRKEKKYRLTRNTTISDFLKKNILNLNRDL